MKRYAVRLNEHNVSQVCIDTFHLFLKYINAIRLTLKYLLSVYKYSKKVNYINKGLAVQFKIYFALLNCHFC